MNGVVYCVHCLFFADVVRGYADMEPCHMQGHCSAQAAQLFMNVGQLDVVRNKLGMIVGHGKSPLGDIAEYLHVRQRQYHGCSMNKSMKARLGRDVSVYVPRVLPVWFCVQVQNSARDFGFFFSPMFPFYSKPSWASSSQ